MKKLFLLMLLTGLFATAYAETAEDYSKVQDMTKQLRFLHDAGVKNHSSYDLNNMSDLKACVQTANPLRSQAKGLKPEARLLNAVSYRFDLILATDAAFSCVYCGDTRDECAKIIPLVEKVEQQLSVDGYPAN